MKRYTRSLALLVLTVSVVFPLCSRAQVDHIVIAAGTDEDRELQAISTETDAQKKLADYEQFVQKFSSNPAAVAYGNWQISQAYQSSGDMAKALDYGDKALANSPRNMDIIISQASIAQQAKEDDKFLEYAIRGGDICSSVSKQPKPADMDDAEFARQIADQKASIQNNCDFLESSGFNLITGENDPNKRMEYIEKYTAAFPESKFQDQVSSYAMYTLGPGQLNDPARLISFGQKILDKNPNSLPALLLLASYYSDDSKAGSLGKAVTYAQKVLEIAKPEAPDADKSRKLSAGVAHSILGYADIKQEKTAASIPELKASAELLKGQDDQQYAVTLYRLGFAYAKLSRTTEAREVLTEAVKIQGPLQKMSEDLLAKVNSARSKGK